MCHDSLWVILLSDGHHSTCLVAVVGCVFCNGFPAIHALLIQKQREPLRKIVKPSRYTKKTIMGHFNSNCIVWNPEHYVPDGLYACAALQCLFIDCLRDTYLHKQTTQTTRFRERHHTAREYRCFDKGDCSQIRQMIWMLNWNYKGIPTGGHGCSQHHFNIAGDRCIPVEKATTSSYPGEKPVCMTQEVACMVHIK